MKPKSDKATKDDGKEEGEKFAVGKVYSVKLTTGDEFNGIVMAYSSDSNFAIFDEGTKPKPTDSKTLLMVNVNFITELKNLKKVKDPPAPKKTADKLDELIYREDHIIRNAEKIGIGVTEEAQMIFDAISKTLPARWYNTDILVMNEVFIRSPYHSDCVFGGPRNCNDRVKTVLKKERNNLQLCDT